MMEISIFYKVFIYIILHPLSIIPSICFYKIKLTGLNSTRAIYRSVETRLSNQQIIVIAHELVYYE